jgi:hypothetical protein
LAPAETYLALFDSVQQAGQKLLLHLLALFHGHSSEVSEGKGTRQIEKSERRSDFEKSEKTQSFVDGFFLLA